jgi:hypothetical protein
MSVICGTFYRAIFNITMTREHIFRLTRILPSRALCNRPLQETLSLFPKLVGCTTAMNVGGPLFRDLPTFSKMRACDNAIDRHSASDCRESSLQADLARDRVSYAAVLQMGRREGTSGQGSGHDDIDATADINAVVA